MTNLRVLSDLFRAAMKLAAACAFTTAIAAAVSAQTNTFPENGNAGIGTTTPAYPLTVNQTGNSVNRLVSLANDSSGSSAQSAISFFEGATEKFKFGMNGSGATGYVGGANALQLWQFQNAPIVVGTNGSERMRINGDGNIGIGTTSPQTRFDIKQSSDTFVGGLHLRRSSTNDTWALVTGDNNSLYMGYANNASGADAASDFTVYPLVLASNGNVGIGATTPVSPLHVAGVTPRINIQDTTGGGSNFALISRLNRLEVAIHGVNTIASFLSSGNVGIGTTTPGYKLDVAGEIRASSGGFRFPDGSVQTTAATGSVPSVFGRTGAVVATTNDYTWAQINKTTSSLADLTTRSASDLSSGTVPTARLGSGTANTTTFLRGDNTWAAPSGAVPSVFGRTGAVVATTNDYTWAQINKTTSSLADLTTRSASDLSSGTLPDARFPATLPAVSGANLTSLNASNLTSGTVGATRLGSGTPNSTTFLRGDNTWAALTSSQWTTNGSNINYAPAGNVGIGVTGTPAEKLHVVGNGKITGNLTVDGTINAKYQDLAEWVPSSEQLSAGTVVVLDTTKSNQVVSSNAAYDTRVAGVISAQPGITLGEGGEGKVLVATTGRVRVKVDASRGAIQIGDLLVTSDVSGVAMKSEPVEFAGRKMHMPGTIIGKALEPLAKGSGEILVLLSLQ